MRVGGMAGGGLLALVVIAWALLTGQDPSRLLEQLPPAAGLDEVATAPIDPAQEPLREFVAVVLADTEEVWDQLFPRAFGQPYERPWLVLFSGGVESACGLASSAAGPFYCPSDQKAYLDLEFFGQLARELHAPGDFAMAYVIAHEIGHHVQNLVGVAGEVHAASRRLGEAEANALSVRLELQADYLAGVWAHHAQRLQDILEPGDVEEALGAAEAIGDDTLQKRSQGYVVPDSFTHGTSEQRLRWFQRGLQTGDVGAMQELFELQYDEL